MSMIDSNWLPEAAEFIYERKLSTEERSELKGIFLEGLIRFLEIYSQTEIGDGIEIDIVKIALHINSPRFENVSLFSFTSIKDVFSLLENMTLNGLPVWRFLKLTDWQQSILEKEYDKLLKQARVSTIKKHPCYGCIWYDENETFLGTAKQCTKPSVGINRFERRGRDFDPDEITECDWFTTLEELPVALADDNISQHEMKHILDYYIPDAKRRFKKYLDKDPFIIPKNLKESEIIDLGKEYDIWDDLGAAFNNLQTSTDRKKNLRKAMCTEGMIRFFELYSKNEIGSSYVADIKNISSWLDEQIDWYCAFEHIVTIEDVYQNLENYIIDGLDVTKFVKYKEE